MSTSTPVLDTAANEWSATFSPDGRWVAYVSDETGRAEVDVRFEEVSTNYDVTPDGQRFVMRPQPHRFPSAPTRTRPELVRGTEPAPAQLTHA